MDVKRSLGQATVGSILTTAALRYPDRPALVCSSTGRRFSFRQTNERCNRLAHALEGLGLVKGDVLAFLCSNRAEIAEIYFALAKTGIIGIPLNYRLAPSEMAELVRAMGAISLICEERFSAAGLILQEQVPALRSVVWIGGGGERGPSYETLLDGASDREPTTPIEEADPYYFNLTSGTTGLPKSYVLSQYNCASGITAFSLFDLTRRDVVLTVFPAFGRVGFAWLASSVALGAVNVLANFDPAGVLALIESESVSIVNLVPTMAAMLLAEPGLAQRRLSSLRAIVFAGSMLPASIREQTTARLCANVYEYYGMQETGAMSVSTPEDRLRRPDSVGLPVAFSQVRIADPQGHEVPTGETGEILARSPNSVSEYFQSPQRSAETFRDGWIHTGDLGRVDSDGFLFICGRTKDMIISGGQNVHSAEIEAVLLRHEGVQDCAVIGLPDPTWGERVVAVLVTAPSVTIGLESLQRFCRGELAGFKLPRQLILRQDPLPRTATGKVQKFLLIDQYKDHQPV